MNEDLLKDELLAMQQGQENQDTDSEEPVQESGQSPEEPQAEEPVEQPQETEAVEEDSDIDKPLGEVMGTKKQNEGRTDDVVPLAKFLDMKKTLEERLTKQEEEILERYANTENSLEQLADEYDVDADFIKRLTASIEAKATKKIQEQYEPIIKKQQEKEKQSEQDKLFDSVYKKVSKSYPELKDVLNKDVIKDLALDERNADKSVKQLIEQVYGGVIKSQENTPSPSFEKSSTVSKKNGEMDFNNLTAKDHETIANDPKLKEQWGEWVINNVNW